MFRSGLLILRPWQPLSEKAISNLLRIATEHVNTNLYIYMAPADAAATSIPLTKAVEQTVLGFYTKSASICSSLDITVIVANIGDNLPENKLNLSNQLDVVLADTKSESLLEYVKSHFSVAENLSEIIELGAYNDTEAETNDNTSVQCYDFTCLGGTFDRLHTGHKILLTKACLLTRKALTVGVTDGSMNDTKTLCELLEPISVRLAAAREFVQQVKPQIEPRVVPIIDPYGPAITDPTLQAIIVSQETLRGGNSVNKKRKEKDMSELSVEVIGLVEDECRAEEEEVKISSSSARMRALGTIIKDVDYSVKGALGPLPYLVGLTGGSASGKTSVARRLEKLGAAVIDCDKLGHRAYLSGSPAFHQVVAEFGADVVGEDGEIDRTKLGPKVFADKTALDKLNSIVWPAIAEMAKQEIQQHREKECRAVVIDAAVLLEAGWDSMVHEVWVAMVPTEEAVRRIMERDNKTEQQARNRISSQLSNTQRLEKANVALCTLWQYEVTQKQVEKAWSLLERRLPCILRRR